MKALITALSIFVASCAAAPIMAQEAQPRHEEVVCGNHAIFMSNMRMRFDMQQIVSPIEGVAEGNLLYANIMNGAWVVTTPPDDKEQTCLVSTGVGFTINTTVLPVPIAIYDQPVAEEKVD